MSGWTDPKPERRPEQKSFLADLLSFGAASTPGREVLVSGLLIGVVALFVFVISPDRFTGGFQWLVMGIAVAYCVFRFIVGISKWRRE